MSVNVKGIIVKLPLLVGLYLLYVWYQARGLNGMIADVTNTLNNLKTKLPILAIPVLGLIYAPKLARSNLKGTLGIIAAAALIYVFGSQAVSAMTSGAGVGARPGRRAAPIMRRL